MSVTEVPELVPVRMLNEYAYCPRLFFLEWADQLRPPSSDTAGGDRVSDGSASATQPASCSLVSMRNYRHRPP